MIREAEISDAPIIYELGNIINQNFKCLFNMADILKKPYDYLLVYVQDQQVVGFIHYQELYDTIDLLNIVVNPLYRRQKIGHKLLNKIIILNKKIILEVRNNNESAINFYEEHGFEVIHKREKYYGDDDAFIMERK